MSESTTLDLIVALASQAHRVDAAARLAEHLRVEAALLFVKDPVLHTLVPAPGMAQTIIGGDAWRSFLKLCAKPGRHVGEVDLQPPTLRRAEAHSSDRVSLVLVGGECRAVDIDLIERVLPLVETMLCGEHKRVIAAAEAHEAREAAYRANALAAALESARAEAARLNADLREEDRHKNEFLAMLAHELRNPLAPIVTSIAVLRRKPAADEQTQRLVELMSRQLGQLSRLIEDLMDVSRVSQGRIELRPQPVDLAKVIADAIDASRQALDDKRHRVSVAMPSEPLGVHGDPARLTQVFSNLLQNAAKYTNPGGEVRVTARQDAGQAVVEVSDNGIGIEAAMLPRIFELFAQVPVSIDRSQGGLGIGLTLVRKLLELHGGSIAAHSAGRGQGSTLVARIPLAPAARVSLGAPVAAASALASLRILVVDDNVDAADVLVDILRFDGHLADAAYDGEAALQHLAAAPHDLVFLDLGLPGMNGYEVARRVRTTHGDKVRLVALSGYGSESARARSRDAGFDAHCVKPISEEQLRALTRSPARCRR